MDSHTYITPLIGHPPGASWTCRECSQPVPGPYAKCENCGHNPTRKAESPYSDPQILSPNDPINPNHYKSHPSGVEAITITEHANFNLGNAIKYIWRYSFGETQKLDDLLKAKWYLEREIARKDVKK